MSADDKITFNVSIRTDDLPKLLHLFGQLNSFEQRSSSQQKYVFPPNEQRSSSQQMYVFPPIEQRSSSQQYEFPPIDQHQSFEKPIEKCRRAIVEINEEIQTLKIDNKKFEVLIDCMKKFCKIVVGLACSQEKQKLVELCSLQLCRIQKCLMIINDDITESLFTNKDFVTSVETSATCIDNGTEPDLKLTFGVPDDLYRLHVSQKLSGEYDLF